MLTDPIAKSLSLQPFREWEEDRCLGLVCLIICIVSEPFIHPLLRKRNAWCEREREQERERESSEGEGEGGRERVLERVVRGPKERRHELPTLMNGRVLKAWGSGVEAEG